MNGTVKVFLFLFAFSLFAQEEQFWSTGPLLNMPGDVLTVGETSIQPYLYAIQYRGAYAQNSRFQSINSFTSILFQPYFRLGIFPRAEIDITPQIYYNHTQGAGKTLFGDTPLWLSVLLWEPVIFQIYTNLPTGKYDKLHPSKLLTDWTGSGAFSTGPGLVLYRDFHLWDAHFLAITYSALYLWSPLTSLKGLSGYGGDATTRGKLRVGNLFQTLLSFEFSFNQNWLFALDTVYQLQRKSTFSGTTQLNVGTPSSQQMSIAPALEYVWSDQMGIIFGSWLTVFGQNATQFVSFVFSLDVIF